MKKNLLFVVAIFLATTMSAQLYVGAKLGYGLGANKYEAGTIMTDNSQSIEWGSMGQGLQLGAKVGYFFSDNLGFELGIDYFMSAEGVIGDVELTMAPGMVYSNDVTAKSNQLRLVPQLVMKSDMGVYSRFGIIVPVMGKTVVTKKEVTPGASTTTADVEMEFKGKFSIGFAGALGYEYALSDNLNLFGELQYTGLTIRGSSSEVTKYSVNGADQLPGMTTIQKETTFVDELDASSNNGSYNTSPDASKPLDDLRSSTVYSSYGFNIGVNFAF
ncbi:MAG: outer membrane beta-barrel protein [Bacteroidales bacterium]|nr:outer membrane beta-barrel protein [Bacteroidales bacterium]